MNKINWIRSVFYLLITLNLFFLGGAFCVEIMLQAKPDPGDSGLIGGWVQLLVYIWPVFFAISILTIWKAGRISKNEMIFAMFMFMIFAAFLLYVS